MTGNIGLVRLRNNAKHCGVPQFGSKIARPMGLRGLGKRAAIG